MQMNVWKFTNLQFYGENFCEIVFKALLSHFKLCSESIYINPVFKKCNACVKIETARMFIQKKEKKLKSKHIPIYVSTCRHSNKTPLALTIHKIVIALVNHHCAKSFICNFVNV